VKNDIQGGGMLKDLVAKTRSYRRFQQDAAVSNETLRELVDLGRLAASGANRQPIKYMLVSDARRNAEVFPLLAWAGYLQDWAGPEEGEKPTAYIVVLGDTEISKNFGVDHGIAIQNILLGATEKGLGGCIIGSVKRDQLRELLKIDARYEILYVVALGKPKEEVVIERIGPDGDVKYWRDANHVHHVPKRSLDEIIVS
jgi:nitroreductase